ncbi:MAG TPA: hypothetical protein VIV40_05550 [Kofleriaceae bacterium]
MPKRRRKRKPKERTWLFGCLAALLSAITIIVIWQTHRLIVPWWGIAAVAAPWAGFDALLRHKQRTLGFERKCVDWWSVPHFFAGVLLGLFGVGVAFVAAIACVWEVVEIYSNVREYPTNRVADVVLAIAGWAAANLVAGGPFPLV